MTRAFVAIGTNVGDRQANVDAALSGLARLRDSRVRRASRLYESEPLGPAGQDAYYNLVAEIETDLGPRDLLDGCKAVERDMGRVKTVRWGPRVIDLDILLFGDASVDEPGLRVPHPEMLNRSFVLVPLAELAPDAEIAGARVRDHAARFDGRDLRPVGPVEPPGDETT